MKTTASHQANRRLHLKHRATHGIHTSLRFLFVFLMCGSLSLGTVVMSQTRSSSSTSRSSTTSTRNTSDSKSEKKADTRSEKKADTRTEKKETPTRSDIKKTETRLNESRTKSESDDKKVSASEKTTTRSQSATRSQPATRSQSTTRSSQPVDNRAVGTRSADVRDGGSREAFSTRLSSSYRLVPGGRSPERVNVVLPDIRFRRDYERCGFCYGVGFLYSHENLHRHRCSHCYGRGFAIEFIVRLDDVCPICYGPVRGVGGLHRRTIQNTASYVMDRLDQLLSLSRSQERAIKRIVLDYLRDSRYDTWYDPIVVRDREIMRELSNRQRSIYIDLMNNLDTRDLCDRCFDYF